MRQIWSRGLVTEVGVRREVYLFSSALWFSFTLVFLRRWLNWQEENIPFCLGHLPAENLLESALDFFGVKQFLA
jgi:hypothetical protein